MKTFRTLLIAAIQHVFLVWGIAIACLCFFSDKSSEAKTGWYIAAACLVMIHAILRVKRARYQTGLAGS
jgi:hypothetical protein